MGAKTDHPNTRQPVSEEIKVWRFMSFTKFMSLISSQSIVFPRSDLFVDPFEGSMPYHSSTQKVRDQIESGVLVPEIGVDNQLAILDHNGSIFRDFRNRVYISCWHANEHESAAMWDLYNADVAIQTTYKKLKDNLPDHSYLGLVKYLDYEKDEVEHYNLLGVNFCKRTSFSHENEVRAVIIDHNASVDIKLHAAGFDFQRCVEKVYVSPAVE